MKLYHRTGAGRPIRIRWALGEAGIDHEVEVLSREEANTDEHRARQPLGRVPVLDDGEGTLFESAALLLHIGDLAGDETLLPRPGTHERALVYQWVMFVMIEVEAPFVEALIHGQDFPERAKIAQQQLQTALGILEKAIDGNTYIVGDRFTAADLLIADILVLAQVFAKMELPPGLASYLEPHRARPARQKAEELMNA